ncbi:MAG: hypothetical protein Q8942_17525, partial [Bacillota bacterium]|nr:hypothetical protein [Bacillota bacterium]
LWRYSNIVEAQRQIIFSRRMDILKGNEDYYSFSRLAPKEYKAALKHLDGEVLIKIQRYLSLYHIDRCWADYLAELNYIREGIHLVNIGGRNPLEEYVKIVNEAYKELNSRIENEITKTYKEIDFSRENLDYIKARIKGPASTWTYQITDNPFSDDLGLLLANERNIPYALLGGLLMFPLVISGLIYTKLKKNKHIK